MFPRHDRLIRREKVSTAKRSASDEEATMPDSRMESMLDQFLRGAMSRRTFMRRAAAAGLSAPAISAVLAASPGTSLAQDAPADFSGELTFWHGLTDEARVLTEQIVPAFTKEYPNVKLNVLQVPFDQLQNKYNTEASAGGGPDVLLGPSDWIGAYVEADVIKAVDDLAGDDFKEGYNPTAIEGVTFEDKVYGVPQNINGVALFYNKNLVPTAPATTDELLAMASEFSGTAGQYGFGLISNFYSNAGYLYGYGGHVFNDDGDVDLDTDATADFLTFLQKVKGTAGVFTQADQGAVESLFKEGKLGMMFDGPWFQQAAAEALGQDKIGLARLPTIAEKDNAEPKPFVGVQSLYINANDEDDQAKLAFEFARWMSTTGTQFLVDQAGQLPASTAVQPAQGDPFAAIWLEQYAAGIPLPSNPKMSLVWTPAGDMITKVLEGQAKPEEAAKEAQETIEKASS